MNHDNNNILISNIDTSSERLPSNIILNPLSKLFYFNNYNKKKASNYHKFINLQQVKNYFSKLKKTKLINHVKAKNNLIPKKRDTSTKNIFNNKKINSYNFQEQSSSLNIDKINNKNKTTEISKLIRLNKSSSIKSNLNRIQSMKNFRKINLNNKFYKRNSNTPKKYKKAVNSIPKSNSIEKIIKINKNIPHPKAKNINIRNKTANNFYKINNSTRKKSSIIQIKYNFYKKTKNIRNHSLIINNNLNDSLQQQNSSYLNSKIDNNITSKNNQSEEHYHSYFKQNSSKIFDVRKHLSDYYKLKSGKKKSCPNNIKNKKINSSNILIPSFMIKNENESNNNMKNYINNNINNNMGNSINNNKYDYTFKNCNNNDCSSINNNEKEKYEKKQFDRRKEDLLQLVNFSDNLRIRNSNIKL